MKKNLLLIIALVASSFSVQAQKNYGFYGKTNFVEVSSVSYFPLIKNLSSSYSGTGYKKSGNSLVSASDWFNTGFRLSVGRAFKKNFAASFEYGVDFWSNNLSMDYYYTGDINQFYVQFTKHENIKVRTSHFMPKIHFASKSALLPLGLNHEIGIGFTSSKVKEQEYLYNITSDSMDPGSSSEYIDFDRTYRGIQLMYCLRMRKPLSKSILLNYGLRYTVDFALASDSPNKNSTKLYSLSNDEIQNIVRYNNFRNILSFDLGLTYAFQIKRTREETINSRILSDQMKINWQGKHLFLCVLFFFVNHFSNAQKNYGFYGKTNFVEITSVSYIPILAKVIDYYMTGNYVDGKYSNGFKSSPDSTLVKASPDFFNTGIRISLARAFKKNVGVSVEYGVDFWSSPVEFDNVDPFDFERHENIQFTTFYVMPKIHFASKNSLLPMGLNHEFGIGLTQSKVKEKDYLNKSYFFTNSPSEYYIDFDRVYRGIQLLYSLKMRKPITKSILINYGLRYTADFSIGTKTSKIYDPYNEEGFDQTSYDIKKIVFINNLTNVLSFDLGLTYAF